MASCASTGGTGSPRGVSSGSGGGGRVKMSVAYARRPQTEEELAHLKHQSFANLDDDPGSPEDWV